MSRPVSTTCFMAVESGTTSAIYNPPAGCTAVLLDMTFWNEVASTIIITSDAFTVALENIGGFVWTEPATGFLHGAYQWSGREVFFTSLLFTTILAGFSFRANGYVLTPT